MYGVVYQRGTCKTSADPGPRSLGFLSIAPGRFLGRRRACDAAHGPRSLQLPECQEDRSPCARGFRVSSERPVPFGHSLGASGQSILSFDFGLRKLGMRRRVVSAGGNNVGQRLAWFRDSSYTAGSVDVRPTVELGICNKDLTLLTFPPNGIQEGMKQLLY